MFHTNASVKSYQLVKVVSGGRAPGKSSSLASSQLLIMNNFIVLGPCAWKKFIFFYCVDFLKIYLIILSRGHCLPAACLLLPCCLPATCCCLLLLAAAYLLLLTCCSPAAQLLLTCCLPAACCSMLLLAATCCCLPAAAHLLLLTCCSPAAHLLLACCCCSLLLLAAPCIPCIPCIRRETPAERGNVSGWLE